jgi:uncharacterized protein YbbK (DUF523 family)
MLDLMRREPVTPVCPENLAGFPTPRPRIHLESGVGGDVLDGRARVIREDGKDVTGAMLLAVGRLQEMAKALGVERAFLKERSPSCGVAMTAGPRGPVQGMGVAAAALRRAGIEVIGVD